MSKQGKPGIVFAHGIWADGSSFGKLIPTLQREGHEVIAAQYGLDTVAGDLSAVKSALARVRSPAILVGHSYGGTLITAAGTDPRVAGLVYIAALAPDANETSQSQQAKFPVTDVFSYVDVTDGRAWMKPEGIVCFAGDLPEEEQKLVWATHAAPAADLFNAESRGHRLAIEAVLVHRGYQGPHRTARAGTLGGEAHGSDHRRDRQPATCRCSPTPPWYSMSSARPQTPCKQPEARVTASARERALAWRERRCPLGSFRSPRPPAARARAHQAIFALAR